MTLECVSNMKSFPSASFFSELAMLGSPNVSLRVSPTGDDGEWPLQGIWLHAILIF